MFAKLLLSLVLIVLIVKGYAVIEGRIQGPAQADFTYNSHVENTADGKLEIANSITNNAGSPLAVRWEDGGIFCDGLFQLAPKDVQSKKTIAQEPYVYDHSEIKYGNAMQFSADGRCYLDKQSRPKDRTQTTVTRQGGTGNELFKIEVTSELSQDGRAADIDFSVKGNFNLILPGRVGAAIDAIPKGGEWEVIKTPSLDRPDIGDEQRKTILMWLGNTPMPKRAGASSNFVVLVNRGGAQNNFAYDGRQVEPGTDLRDCVRRR